MRIVCKVSVSSSNQASQNQSDITQYSLQQNDSFDTVLGGKIHNQRMYTVFSYHILLYLLPLNSFVRDMSLLLAYMYTYILSYFFFLLLLLAHYHELIIHIHTVETYVRVCVCAVKFSMMSKTFPLLSAVSMCESDNCGIEKFLILFPMHVDQQVHQFVF